MVLAGLVYSLRKLLGKILCLVALVLLPCSAVSQTIDILAAASTTEAVTAIATNIERDHGTKLRLTFAASSTLAKHIASGAPAHLFLSADLSWMEYLHERDFLIPGATVNLLGNKLVLLGRNGDPTLTNLAGLSRALGNERLIMGNPGHVPAGRYAQQVLQHLGLWGAISGRAVYGASVRAALALLARGQGRYAIAYATDGRVYPNLSIAAVFSVASHQAIIYPLALVRGQDNAQAHKVFKYLQSSSAKVIFEQFGFAFLPKPR